MAEQDQTENHDLHGLAHCQSIMNSILSEFALESASNHDYGQIQYCLADPNLLQTL